MSEQVTTFSDTEIEQQVEYRPVNRWVIAAVPATLLSLLVYVHPVLFVLPVVAAILSVVALGTMAPDQAGRRVAQACLFVTLFCGSMAVTWMKYRESLLVGQARVFAEQWLDLVAAGEAQKAHQLTQIYSERAPLGTPLDQYYEPPPPSDDPQQQMRRMMEEEGSPWVQLDGFMKEPPLDYLYHERNLVDLQPGQPRFTYRFVEVHEVEQVGTLGNEIYLHYALTDRVGRVYRLRLKLTRLDEPHAAYWNVADLIDLSPRDLEGG